MQDTYQPTPEQEKLIARFMVDGSLHTWNFADQFKYIRYVNERAGLPFGTISMIDTGKDDKLKRVPYATRQAAAALRKKYDLSLMQMSRHVTNERAEFTYRATDPDGIFVDAVGSCSLIGKHPYPMSPDMQSNKVMHADTKAKRRAVLDYCEIAILDDSELESVEHTKVDLAAIAAAVEGTAGDTVPKPVAATPPTGIESSVAPASSLSGSVLAATPSENRVPKGNGGTKRVAPSAVAPPVVALAFEPALRYAEHAALFQGDAAAIVADKAHMDCIVHWATQEAGWDAATMSKWLFDTFGVRAANAKETLTLEVFRKIMAGIDQALTAGGR